MSADHQWVDDVLPGFQQTTLDLGTDPDGPRWLAVASARPWSDLALRRLRMLAAVARQGFDLCGARERPTAARVAASERPLEPLLTGFICASPSMQRVVEQVQRLQGNDLTVLITGESGTGKELVARAIHVGSLPQDYPLKNPGQILLSVAAKVF